MAVPCIPTCLFCAPWGLEDASLADVCCVAAPGTLFCMRVAGGVGWAAYGGEGASSETRDAFLAMCDRHADPC